MNRPRSSSGGRGSSAPAAANGRGLLLLAVAFVIGIAILRATDPGGGSVPSAVSVENTPTTRGGRTATTVATPTTINLARPPAEVKVLPVNASGIAGIGGKTGDKLRTAGYTNTLAAVNSTSDTPLATTTVEFIPNAEGDAAAVAAALGLPVAVIKPLASPPPVDDTRGADVVVVIGGDLATGLGGASATTSTTEG